jgi:hypothetical protein
MSRVPVEVLNAGVAQCFLENLAPVSPIENERPMPRHLCQKHQRVLAQEHRLFLPALLGDLALPLPEIDHFPS